jgi:hypothetical protein
MEKHTCGGRVSAGLGVGGGRFMLSGGDWRFIALKNRRRRGEKVSKFFWFKVQG